MRRTHQTRDCKEAKDQPSKCTKFREPHPASYCESGKFSKMKVNLQQGEINKNNKQTGYTNNHGINEEEVLIVCYETSKKVRPY